MNNFSKDDSLDWGQFLFEISQDETAQSYQKALVFEQARCVEGKENRYEEVLANFGQYVLDNYLVDDDGE